MSLAFQAMVSAYPVGLAALLALDVGVVVLLDAVITLMGKGAPHLWLPGQRSTVLAKRKYRLSVCSLELSESPSCQRFVLAGLLKLTCVC